MDVRTYGRTVHYGISSTFQFLVCDIDLKVMKGGMKSAV